MPPERHSEQDLLLGGSGQVGFKMRLLVATDGKNKSYKAVELAFRMALGFDCPLYILFVVAPDSRMSRNETIKMGMRVLGRLKLKASGLGVEVETLMEAGNPAEIIIEASRRLDADAVLIGAPEPGGIFKSVKKSTAMNVYSGASCTVYIVK